ncbi:hypothetical protein Tsubulata_035780 [Turnera subulata]|uniref:RNA helicase n=1 Tax=Turnera subulata TaxID=218843 RepID=A0A9Q0F756_9ROSI|nr:hypothetical protein Tsubulata_035780 [Turnera subulata]
MGAGEEEKVESFKELGLCEELVEACNRVGWTTPSPIQAEAIPLALQGKDLIALANTGTGKTAAFALPILQSLLQVTPPQSTTAFFACVLSPTRELAVQIRDEFAGLGSGIGLRCALLAGGLDKVQQTIELAKRPHIVVATPGRLLDHLTNTKGFSLRTLKFLILDEADRLLDDDFESTLDQILQVIPRDRKTYLFSATMTRKVQKLQRACLRNPVKVEVASKYSTVDTLKQQFVLCPPKLKECGLLYLLMLKHHATTMVFTRTCDTTQLLALILRNLGLRAIPINGHMSQTQRLAALNKFKASICNILVCTDVASRGLDIPSVDTVINYDFPSNTKDYIHRVGRTARAGQSGLAISLVSQYELAFFSRVQEDMSGLHSSLECLYSLIRKNNALPSDYFRHFSEIEIPTFPADLLEVKLLLERVNEAKRIAQMEIKETRGRKKRATRDEEEGTDKYLGIKNRKKIKKLKR